MASEAWPAPLGTEGVRERECSLCSCKLATVFRGPPTCWTGISALPRDFWADYRHRNISGYVERAADDLDIPEPPSSVCSVVRTFSPARRKPRSGRVLGWLARLGVGVGGKDEEEEGKEKARVCWEGWELRCHSRWMEIETRGSTEKDACVSSSVSLETEFVRSARQLDSKALQPKRPEFTSHPYYLPRPRFLPCKTENWSED